MPSPVYTASEVLAIASNWIRERALMKAIHHTATRTTWLFLSILMAGLHVAAQIPARLVIDQNQDHQVPRAQKLPKTDGTLDDPARQHAAVFKEFKTFHPTAGKPPQNEPRSMSLTITKIFTSASTPLTVSPTWSEQQAHREIIRATMIGSPSPSTAVIKL